MKRYEPIYREFYDLLQELLKTAHAYKRLTDIPFRKPKDRIKSKHFDELQGQKRAIKYKVVTEPNKFDFLELHVENPHATLYSVDILQPNFDNLLKECEEFFGSNSSSIDIKEQFGFEGKKFWLKRVGGQNLTINFSPKNGETTDPFCLMQALVDYIRSHGQVKNDYLTTVVPIQEIINYLNKNFSNLKSDDFRKWIRYTRNNLLQKMTEDDKKLVIIKNFDRQENGYPFSIKIPPTTQ